MTTSNPMLSSHQIANLLSFLGYGNPRGPIWFVGPEEGLGGAVPEDAAKNLLARSNFTEVMDLREAHLQLVNCGHPIDTQKKPPRNQVWPWIAKIMLAYHARMNQCSSEKASDYVRMYLGRTIGQSFMTELSPVPSKSKADQVLLNWFKHNYPQFDLVVAKRRERLIELYKTNRPSHVICYGRGHADDFASFFKIDWCPLTQHICRSREREFWLLPFFGNGQMSQAIAEDLYRHAFN